MRDAGQAILGIGMGTGDSRATFAAERAISSPILDASIDGARGILLSITGGEDLSLIEVSEAARVIQEAAHPDANIIFGANVDKELTEQVWVTVIATRFDSRGRRADGSRGELRRAPRAQKPRPESKPERQVGTPGEMRPRDLDVEAPEFEPSR
jgi:cell division protein FtsZ